MHLSEMHLSINAPILSPAEARPMLSPAEARPMLSTSTFSSPTTPLSPRNYQNRLPKTEGEMINCTFINEIAKAHL